jgi:uroporphyrinogen-III decarboxylase
MDSRGRIAAILNGNEPDQVGFQDADFFADTIRQWHAQGLPSNIDTAAGSLGPWLNVRGLRHFQADIYVTWPDISLKYDAIDYEVGDDWKVIKDIYGTTAKWWTEKSGTPQYLDPIVKTPKDFEEKVEPLLDAHSMRRVSGSNYPFKQELENMTRHFQKEFFVVAGIEGPLGYSMYLCGGLARTLIFLMRNQDFMQHMLSSIGDFLARICESYIEAGVDGVWVFDDQGSRDRPFLSPALYEKLLKPAHQRICDPFRRKGLPRLLHSDGSVESIIPHLIDAGFVALQPFQNDVMDIRKVKETYGSELTLMGGIDTRVLSSGDFDAIRKEVASKISIAGKGGGYIVTSDGPVPPTVSLESYQFFRELVREYGKYPLKI